MGKLNEIRVSDQKEYYPFGMLLKGRSWQSGSAYRYGFNGKEIITEYINTLDFGNRIYDGKLGRWFSPDLLEKAYPNISTYTFVGNSPIMMIDIDGNGIYNFWTKKIAAVENQIINIDDNLENYKALYGTLTNKKEFYKNGGSKSEWNSVKGLNKERKVAVSTLDTYKLNEQITNDMLAGWKAESPDTYNELDNLQNEYGETVDIYIKNEDIFDVSGNTLPGSVIGGYNDPPKYEVNDAGEVRPFSLYGVNTMIISFEENKFDRDMFEKITGQDIFNHEGGHAWYIATHTKEYKEYTDQLIKEGRDYNGGHNDDDKSGQAAQQFGKRKS